LKESENIKLKKVEKSMNFTTNWHLYKSSNSKKKITEDTKTEIETTEFKNKIKLIKKAFH